MNNSNRRKFLSTAAALTAGTAATAMTISPASKKYGIAHQVYFWLKRAGSEEDRQELIKGIKTLKNIESVREIYIGIVANTEKRSVIDSSWAVSELLYFDNVEGQAVYQTHAIHQEFAKNYSHLWEKVVVYDSALL
uniref:Dabb family protein n=1 Tax=Daejeonella sp. TaxID=2805397 RepID=UPI00404B28E5